MRSADQRGALVAEEKFGITYDGPALHNHRMDVRDLAPALVHLADAVERTQELIAPGTPIRLEIEATAPGSFLVDLLLRDLPEIYRQGVAIFSGPEVTAALQLKDVVESLVASVMLALQIHKLGKPTETSRSAESKSDAPDVRLKFADGTTYELSENAWKVFQDGQVRLALRGALRPLESDGVERFVVSHGNQVVEIEGDEVHAFDAPDSSADILIDRVDEMVVQPVDITFRVHGKWRVTNGPITFHVTVDDEAFIERVERGAERFGKADLIRANVRMVQKRVDGRLTTEYTIVRVLEHIQGGTQGSFDIKL